MTGLSCCSVGSVGSVGGDVGIIMLVRRLFNICNKH